MPRRRNQDDTGAENEPIAPAEVGVQQQGNDSNESDDDTYSNPSFDPRVAATIATAIVQAQATARATTGPFALTPALATQGPLDLSSEQGSRIYSTGTKSLYAKHDDPFDCDEGGLVSFLNRINNRSKEMGWDKNNNAIMLVPSSYDNNGNKVGPFHNLITNYGEVTKERIQEHERRISAVQGRAKQDLFMLYKCITASLSAEGEGKLNTWRDDYVYDDIQGGLSLLFTITREASLVTNASIESLRRELNTLDEYATHVKGDVEKINAKAQLIVQKLKARGQQTTELMTNLFKAYETIKDGNFERYISNVRDRHEDGTDSLSGEALMQKAMAQYKKLKDQGKWNETTDTEKLLALANQIKDLKSKYEKKKSSNTSKNHDKKKGTKKPRPKWLTDNIKPSDVKETKRHGDITFHWCCEENGGKCGGRWRAHKPKDCYGAAAKRKGEEKQDKDNDKGKKKPRVQAFEALMNQVQEDVSAMKVDGEDSDQE